MDKTTSILEDISNRNFPLPGEFWKYYQEWNQVLFLHWKIDPSILVPLLPAGLKLDTIAGDAWVSLVPFSVRGSKLRTFPRIPYLSEFEEVNLRTYVIKDGVPGIYLFSIETQKWTTIMLARMTLGVSYNRSSISRTWHAITVHNKSAGTKLDLRYSVKQPLYQKTELDFWLTERHALYTLIHDRLFRFDIHHKEWKLKTLFLGHKQIDYSIDNFQLPLGEPDKLHYSKKIRVLVWGRKDVTESLPNTVNSDEQEPLL